MKLLNGIDLLEFLSAVAKCDGNVWFETDEGDHLNLKSELCKYLFATISSDEEIINRAYINCDEAHDYTLLEAYLRKD